MSDLYPPPGQTMTAAPVFFSVSGRKTVSVGRVTLVTFFPSHFSSTAGPALPGALPLGHTSSVCGSAPRAAAAADRKRARTSPADSGRVRIWVGAPSQATDGVGGSNTITRRPHEYMPILPAARVEYPVMPQRFLPTPVIPLALLLA